MKKLLQQTIIISLFKKIAIKFYALVTLASLASLPANAENKVPQKAITQIQGLWKVTSLTANGNQAPAKSFKGARFLIKGENISLSGQAKDLRVYRINPTAKPKTIDMSNGKGNESAKGIYKVDGDTMTLCFSQSTKLDRPKTFDTTGTKYLSFTLNKNAEPQR